MSESAKLVTEFPRGDYEITSIFPPGNRTIGVDSTDPPQQPVQIDAPVWVWRIEPAGVPDGYRFSLVNAYPYTGQDDEQVVAAKDQLRDRVWYIYKWNEHYQIAAAPIWPTPVWTVSSEETNAKVVIRRHLFPEPAASQLFDIKRLPEE